MKIQRCFTINKKNVSVEHELGDDDKITVKMILESGGYDPNEYDLYFNQRQLDKDYIVKNWENHFNAILHNVYFFSGIEISI